MMDAQMQALAALVGMMPVEAQTRLMGKVADRMVDMATHVSVGQRDHFKSRIGAILVERMKLLTDIESAEARLPMLCIKLEQELDSLEALERHGAACAQATR